MKQFDPLYELNRLTFITHRDGIEKAKIFTKGLIKIYLSASLSSRQKFHTRNYPYRQSYIESAYSARHILRSDLLQGVL